MRAKAEELEEEYEAWFIARLQSREVGQPFPPNHWTIFVTEVVVPRERKDAYFEGALYHEQVPY